MELKPWDNKVSKLILETMEQGFAIFKEKLLDNKVKEDLVSKSFKDAEINEFTQHRIDMIWDFTNASVYLESLIEGAKSMLEEVKRGREKMNA
jgi:hypothetical protein